MVNCPKKIRDYIKTLNQEKKLELKNLPKKAQREHGNRFMDIENFSKNESSKAIKFFNKIGKKFYRKEKN